MHSLKQRAFTLIELLVVIAIIAVLAVVVILSLNPAALLQQSRDSNRISDMATLTSALGLYNADQAGSQNFNMGSVSLVYASVADQAATSSAGTNCATVGLPSLPTIYTYHCAASSTYRGVTGNGWIPVNFSNITSGSPLGTLSLDPLNQTSTHLYYSYATNGTQYETTADLESQKYKLGGSNDATGPDGSPLATVYAKGNSLTLEPLEYGDTSMALYWTLNEGTGTIAYDYSGNNATGSWNGVAGGTNSYYSSGKVWPWAGTFVGANSNYVSTPFQYSLTGSSNFTWSAWMDISTSGTVNTTIIGNRYSSGSTWVKVTPSGFEYGNGKIINYNLPLGSWNLVTVTKSGNSFSYYLNGVVVGTATSAAAVTSEPFYVGGDPNFPSDGYITGFVGDVRLYSRALSAAEVAALYSGGK